MKRMVAAIGAAFILSTGITTHAEEVPADVRAVAEEIGEQYCICPELIEAICYQESRFQPEAIGTNGQYIGIMQVSPAIHKARMQRLGVTDLTDMRGGMLVGTDYLAELFGLYEDPAEALMVYGGWGRRIEHYEQTGDMPEYVKAILERSEQYEREHQK